MRKFIAAVCLFAASMVNAAELNSPQAWSIWIVAWGKTFPLHGGARSILDAPPSIRITDNRASMCRAIAAPDDCLVFGTTGPDETVWIWSGVDFGTVVGSAVLFHEFVHVIQNRTRGLPTTCEEYNYNEREVMRLHAELLADSGDFRAADHARDNIRQLDCSQH